MHEISGNYCTFKLTFGYIFIIYVFFFLARFVDYSAIDYGGGT